MDEHRKERNIARSRPDKLEKLKRDKERDISEKIALGLPDSRSRASGETQFDSRLFNQTGVRFLLLKKFGIISIYFEGIGLWWNR
jgi:hypothetical protein